jgi:hypothetical protein
VDPREGRQAGKEWLGAVGYAARVSSLVPLSVTGVVLFTACLALVVVAGLGIFALLRGRRGE